MRISIVGYFSPFDDKLFEEGVLDPYTFLPYITYLIESCPIS